jgi:4'-phosphopantetheinyl transferase
LHFDVYLGHGSFVIALNHKAKAMTLSVSTPVAQRTVQHLPAALTLPRAGALHLWSVATPPEIDPTPALSALLSPEERTRWQRYVTPVARRQFLESRGLLRLLLGTYLQRDPGRLEFFYSEQGKPSLTEASGGNLLQFNVSHSQGRVLYAVSADHAVGVDLECVNSRIDCRGLAHRICTPQERTIFDRLPPEEQSPAFFKIWTRKEALVKLSSDRLYEKLSVFEVPACATSGSYWVQVEDRNIWLQDLELFESFAAAIALPALPAQIVHHEWHYGEEES